MRCVSHVAKDADISSICCANRREVGTAVLEAYLSWEIPTFYDRVLRVFALVECTFVFYWNLS